MILVTGASGFLGRRLVQLAWKQGRQVRAFCRRPTPDLQLPADVVFQGDITEPATLTEAVEGVEAVIHAAATTSETAPDEALSRRTNVDGTRNLIEACAKAGVTRWVQISSLSANRENSSVYGRTKFAADEEVRRSGLRWTILQPGTIYGPGGRGLFAKMARLTGALPGIVPVLGSGKQTMRPIFLDDAARAPLDCLDHDTTVGRTYALGCRDAITFNDFIRGVLRAQGKRKLLLHVPFWFCFPVARLLGWVLKKPPVTVDNLVGLKQMKAPEITAAERDFGFDPLTFAEGLERTFHAAPEQPAAVQGAA
jgi:nucleoside-diphosphate-sugar epimerase